MNAPDTLIAFVVVEERSFQPFVSHAGDRTSFTVVVESHRSSVQPLELVCFLLRHQLDELPFAQALGMSESYKVMFDFPKIVSAHKYP